MRVTDIPSKENEAMKTETAASVACDYKMGRY